MCVSRSGMRKYSVDAGSRPVVITDKRDQPITLQKAIVAGSTDPWLHGKELKESGMNGRFSQRFEERLKQIQQNLGKKNGVKKQAKVWERIGRLKAKYTSIHKHYELTVTVDKQGIATDLQWKQKAIEKKEGYYLLRTTLNQIDEAMQWTIYNTIREIEATFRILKTDLELRPVYHYLSRRSGKLMKPPWHTSTWDYWPTGSSTPPATNSNKRNKQPVGRHCTHNEHKKNGNHHHAEPIQTNHHPTPI